MSIIRAGMVWPPRTLLEWKMEEHSAWYSGDAEVLANFYAEYANKNVLNIPFPLQNNEMFWGRQIKNQGEIFVHVPLAGDIAETSANFLFAEPPIIKIAQSAKKGANASYKSSQLDLSVMIRESGLNAKLSEAAEACSAIGGIYIKVAWDSDLSPHPIPVVVQTDRAIPEFKFGILTAVTFWKTIQKDESESKVYRLLERYEKGRIGYTLWLGTGDRLGANAPLDSLEETKDLVDVDTIDELLVVYIPNMLPNRLDRNSYLGRSDLSGIEGLMDSLDEVFTSWIKDIALAQAKILLPSSYLEKTGGKSRYNLDRMLYVELDMDPTTATGNVITPQQFAIRADEFEKTALNFMERIITSAGYSPQSFGLNIAGRAESGTALSMRERKSFATKNKKQNYWKPAIEKLIKMMMMVSNEELSGKYDVDVDITVTFNDGITNNLNEVANSVKLISDARAASTLTKVTMLHPDWSEEEIDAEVKAILDEDASSMPNPDDNPDMDEMNKSKESEEDEDQI